MPGELPFQIEKIRRIYRLDVVFTTIEVPPGFRTLAQYLVYGLDITHPLILQPLSQGLRSILGINFDAVLPRCPAAQHAGEWRISFGGKFECL